MSDHALSQRLTCLVIAETTVHGANSSRPRQLETRVAALQAGIPPAEWVDLQIREDIELSGDQRGSVACILFANPEVIESLQSTDSYRKLVDGDMRGYVHAVVYVPDQTTRRVDMAEAIPIVRSRFSLQPSPLRPNFPAFEFRASTVRDLTL